MICLWSPIPKKHQKCPNNNCGNVVNWIVQNRHFWSADDWSYLAGYTRKFTVTLSSVCQRLGKTHSRHLRIWAYAFYRETHKADAHKTVVIGWSSTLWFRSVSRASGDRSAPPINFLREVSAYACYTLYILVQCIRGFITRFPLYNRRVKNSFFT